MVGLKWFALSYPQAPSTQRQQLQEGRLARIPKSLGSPHTECVVKKHSHIGLDTCGIGLLFCLRHGLTV